MFDVSVIVFSYNRPRMLSEALASIQGAAQVIVVDDGSDFDVEAVARAFPFPDLIVTIAPPLTVEERMTVPRFGSNVNAALRRVTCGSVAYLCDDDLFHPTWLAEIDRYFADHPEVDFLRGHWLVFEEGEPLEAARPCPLDWRQMTAGNFAHRSSLPLRWDETTVTHHDDRLLRSLQKTMNLSAVPCTGTIAGYRREHAKTTFRVTPKGKYGAAARDLLSGGFLE